MADEPKRKSIAEIDEELKGLNSLSAIDKERIENLEKQKELLKQIVALNEKENLTAQASIEKLTKRLSRESDKEKIKKVSYELAQKELELAEKELQNAELLGEKNKEKLDSLKEELKLKEKNLEELEKDLEKEKKLAEIRKEGVILLKQMGQALQTMVGSYGQAIISQMSLNGLTSTFGSMVNEIVETQRKLAAETGITDLLPENLSEAVSGFEKYGVGVAELGKSYGTLNDNFASFSNLNKSTQNEIAATAASFENLGITVETQGKLFQTFGRGMGMSALDASKQIKNISIEAERLGVSPKKAIQDLSSILPQLAANGANATKVFFELQKQSKQLGVEVGSLMNIVGKSFDTFEGAAEKAGQLNAMLGGDYLNSVEMLNATESERVELLKKGFEQSGKNFDQMGRYEKKSITAILGAKDEFEARSLLGQLTIEEQIQAESKAKAEKELEKARLASVDTQRLLTLAFSEFLQLAKPVAEAIRYIVETLAAHTTAVKSATIILLTFVAIFKGVQLFMGFQAVIAGLASSFGALTVAAVPAGASTAGAITLIGQAAAASALGLLALGGTIALIGLGIGLAAYGLAQFVASFKGLEPSQLVAAGLGLVAFGVGLGILVAGLAAMVATGVAEVAALALLGLGAGIALIGLGVMLAAEGMAKLVDSIGKIVSGPARGAGAEFKEISVGILALSTAMYTFSTSSLFSFGDEATKMVSTIKKIGDAINELPETAEFKGKVETLKTVNETIKTASIAAPTITPTTDFIKAAKEYYIVQKESKTADNDALVQALKAVVSKPDQKQTASGGGRTPVRIIIENGRELIGSIDNRSALTIGD